MFLKFQEIEQFIRQSGAEFYLNHIAFEGDYPELIKSLAALLLKNKIKTIAKNEKDLDALVQTCGPSWMRALQNEALTSSLRRSLYGVVATVACIHQPSQRDIISLCLSNLKSFESILIQICEDVGPGLDRETVGMIVKGCSSEINEHSVLRILSQFTYSQLITHISLANLLHLCSLTTADEDLNVTKGEFLLALLEQVQFEDKKAILSTFIPLFFKYTALCHPFLEALTEVFLENGDDAFDDCFSNPALFEAFLQCVLERCVYDEDADEDELCRALEDLSVPDSVERFKPSEMNDNDDEWEEGEIAAENEPDFLDSIRNCLLATVQVLTHCCDQERLATVLLRLLNPRLQSKSPLICESALMVISVCTELMNSASFSEQIMPVLQFCVSSIQSNQSPLVRSAALKCLGAFVDSFDPSWNSVIIDALRDRNKRVQENACKAILSLFSAQIHLEPTLLLPSLISALGCYQSRNRQLVYRIISDYAETLSDNFDLKTWNYIALLLLDGFSDEAVIDGSIFALVSALQSIIPLVKPFPQLDSLFVKACRLACLFLRENQTFSDEHYLVAGLDLIDAIIEHNQSIVPEAAVASIAELLKETFAQTDLESSTLQSAFALFGDLMPVKTLAFDSYWTSLFVNCIPSSLDKSGDLIVALPTASNAIWSLGMFCEHGGRDERVFSIQDRLLSLLQSHPRTPLGSRLYFENLAVALARSFKAHPRPHLDPSVRDRLCKIISTVSDQQERQSSLAILQNQ